MKPDDPKLTAFVLGELSPEETAQLAVEIAESPELAEALGHIERTAMILKGAARVDPIAPLTMQQRAEIYAAFRDSRVAPQRERRSRLWMPILVGAAACLLLLPLAPWWHWWRSQSAGQMQAKVTMPAPEIQVAIAPRGGGIPGSSAPVATEEADQHDLIATSSLAVSSIPLEKQDSSAFDTVSAEIESGRRPAPEKVNAFGILQHFQFNYPPASGLSPVSLVAEIGDCPWQPGRRLVCAAMKVRQTPNLLLRDVGLQMRFDPKTVKAWRLIGVEQASGAGNQDPEIEPVDLSAGEHVVALFEVEPVSPEVSPRCTLLFRHTEPNDPVWRTFELAARESPKGNSEDYRFAAAVTAFSLKLRDPEWQFSWEAIRELSTGAIGTDPGGERTRFLNLVEKARLL